MLMPTTLFSATRLDDLAKSTAIKPKTRSTVRKRLVCSARMTMRSPRHQPFGTGIDSIGYYGLLAGKTGQDTGDFNRLAAANHATSFDEPRLAISIEGTGGAAGNTAIGQRLSLAAAAANPAYKPRP